MATHVCASVAEFEESVGEEFDDALASLERDIAAHDAEELPCFVVPVCV